MASGSIYTDCKFHLSSDVNLDVKVFISQLWLPDGLSVDPESLYVTAQLQAGGIALHGVTVSTDVPELHGQYACWDEWLTIPLKIRDLPPTTQIVITVWGVGPTMLAGTTIRVFDQRLRLKRGLQCLTVWPVNATAPPDASTTTPPATDPEYFRLLKLQERFNHRDIARLPWLDRLTLRQIESYRLGLTTAASAAPADPPASATTDSAEPWELEIQLPYFEFPVIYNEVTYDKPDATPVPVAVTDAASSDMWRERLHIVWDPEMGSENPAENKYHKLARSQFREFVDVNLKPNKQEKDKISVILSSPASKIPADHLDILWKFRYSLTSNPKAVTKFVMCVDWNDDAEAKMATELLGQWAQIDVEDALHLLSPEFTHLSVREFAVDALRRASDEELLSFLLQLVQALRYEPMLNDDDDGTGPPTPVFEGGAPRYALSPLADFLVQRAVGSLEIANFLHWFLVVEVEDKRHGTTFSIVHTHFLAALDEAQGGEVIAMALADQSFFVKQLFAARADAVSKRRDHIGVKISKLNKMLAPDGTYGELSSLREPVLLPIDPKLKITGVVPGAAHIFRSNMYPMVASLAIDPSADEWSQAGADAGIAATTSESKTEEGVEEPRPVVPFKCIFKHGDDMRQDQLIMQFIRLMDLQLKRVNLDLKLTPYKVLATAPDTGLMEMVVHSKAVSAVLKDYNNSILAFFKKAHPMEGAEYGIDPRVMDTYVKSCAGYCVITFLLSIGDRHLDNVMLQSDGHLFHIDFGYILGHDPKPFPPPMKLTKEMVEGMGGLQSENYRQFLHYCCLAYNELRKHANLVLNLLKLMRGAGLYDLDCRGDPNTIIMKIQDNFRLEIDDEAAEVFFLDLVQQSMTAIFPKMAEVIHKIAVSLR